MTDSMTIGIRDTKHPARLPALSLSDYTYKTGGTCQDVDFA